MAIPLCSQGAWKQRSLYRGRVIPPTGELNSGAMISGLAGFREEKALEKRRSSRGRSVNSVQNPNLTNADGNKRPTQGADHRRQHQVQRRTIVAFQALHPVDYHLMNPY